MAQEPPPSEPQFVLPTVKVEGETGPYNVQDSGLVRVPTPLLDTPQSVVVVPGAVIEQQRANTVRDALRNVSGITISAGEGGRQGDTFILRGFTAQPDVFRDGVRDLGWFTRDTFNLQNVEVYFGPSALLFGRGSTGGAVNLRDQDADQRHQRVGQSPGRDRAPGSPGGRRQRGAHRRLPVPGERDGAVLGVPDRNEASANRAGVAPSIRWRLGERTTLELDYFYQHEHNCPTTDTRTTHRRPVRTAIRSRTTSACPGRPGTA